MKHQAHTLYLTTSEVAAQLRVRPSTVRWLIRTQQLTAQRIAEEFLIEKSDLVAFIDAHTIRGQTTLSRKSSTAVMTWPNAAADSANLPGTTIA